MRFFLVFLHTLLLIKAAWAEPCIPDPASKAPKQAEDIEQAASNSVHDSLKEAISVQIAFKKPVKMIKTKNKDYPEFPSYSQCEPSFFRVATVDQNIGNIITKEGWKSGWVRKAEELKKSGSDIDFSKFSALPPTKPFEDRIVEYVRVKNVPSEFPKDSSVVGVHDNPIRNLSVGYHTGYNSGMQGNPMRMDEIEVGPCAKKPECQKIQVANSEEVFKKKKLIPRYSVEGEWAIENAVPPACVVATYRIKFQKIDGECYSDANGNCNFAK